MPALRWGPWVLRQPPWRLLATFTALHAAAVALFSSGFLLTRVELTQRSRCNDDGCGVGARVAQEPHDRRQCVPEADKQCTDGRFDAASARDASKTAAHWKPGQPDNQAEAGTVTSGCCGQPQYSKTLWLIIDALRFDFVLHEPAALGLSSEQGDAALGMDPPPPHDPPPLPPHVQRMPELLSLARDWVRTL